MEIAMLGGTGDIGRGLALRMGHDTDHAILIGSREAARAEDRAATYRDTLTARGGSPDIAGAHNEDVASRGDIVILAVPPYHIRSLTESIGGELGEGAILVSPAVGMQRDQAGFHYDPPGRGSVTELVAASAPGANPVIGAYHTLAADRLADLDATLGVDTPIFGDDPAAKSTVIEFTRELEGLRPLDAGPLTNAPEAEGITPLLLNIAQQNDGMDDLGVRFR